jgi:hypothetical protein
MFTINYALLKGKSQWLRKWLCQSQQQPLLLLRLLHLQLPQQHRVLR